MPSITAVAPRRFRCAARRFDFVLVTAASVCICLFSWISIAAGSRMIETIFQGEHLEDMLYSFPRPALVGVYDSRNAACLRSWNDFVDGLRRLPSTQRLESHEMMITGYDVSVAPLRAWYEYTGDTEFDFAEKLGVYSLNECPQFRVVTGGAVGGVRIEDSHFYLYEGRFSDAASVYEWAQNVVHEDPLLIDNSALKRSVVVETYKRHSYDIANSMNMHAQSDPRLLSDAKVGDFIVVSDSATKEPIMLQKVDGIKDVVMISEAPELRKLTKRMLKKRMSGIDAERREQKDAMDWSHTRRHLTNMIQPPLMPQYTERGYKKLRVPEDSFASLLSFYNEQKASNAVSIESWHKHATQINFEKVKTGKVFYPRTRELAEMLLPILEDWAGIPLEFSMGYGIREYYRGSRLFCHTDRIETHIVSAIINVAQENMDSDWKLEFYDLANASKAHVAMQPGDLVLYESSKLVHGRPQPLDGDMYANIFMHWRPKGDWKYRSTDQNEIVLPSGEKVDVYDHDHIRTPFAHNDPAIKFRNRPFFAAKGKNYGSRKEL